MHPAWRALQVYVFGGRAMSGETLVLFAKAPNPGRVKTRLIPWLGPERAAALHRAFVEDCLETLAGFEVELHTDRAGWIEFPRTRLQSQGDLGERMYHAASTVLDAGAGAVCILGADAPTLPASHIKALFHSGADVTLGPAEDGGYWGICFRRLSAGMFDGVEWSSPQTLAQTIESVQRTGLTTALGPTWWDVDEPADLKRLLESASLPRHTAQWFAGDTRHAE